MENTCINALRPRQNGRHFADDVFKCIFLNENVWITLQISLKFVHKGLINNILPLFQIMAWRRPGDKPLSEPMMVSLLTHICVTRPQWVKQWCLLWFLKAWQRHRRERQRPLSFTDKTYLTRYHIYINTNYLDVISHPCHNFSNLPLV